MKITIIDQCTDTVHEVAPETTAQPAAQGLGWFDSTMSEHGYLLTEDDETVTNKRIRFIDGREVEVDCKTGDLVGV